MLRLHVTRRRHAGGLLVEALLAIVLISAALLASVRAASDSLALQHEIRDQLAALQLYADASEPAFFATYSAASWPAAEQQRLRDRAARALANGDIEFQHPEPVVTWTTRDQATARYPASDE